MSGRQQGQAFESCPAATGSPDADAAACAQFPDGAHRCGEPRDSHAHHRCTCGLLWATTAITEAAPGLFMPTAWRGAKP